MIHRVTYTHLEPVPWILPVGALIIALLTPLVPVQLADAVCGGNGVWMLARL
jgi:hypothetical protein